VGKRNYHLLLASQYLSAFGDNAILAVILGQLTFLHERGEISESYLRTANAIYTSLLFIPYVLLAPVVGWTNDRFPKTRCLRWGNMLKLVGAAVCALSIWSGPTLQGIGYLVVGIGACLYSPGKYGILPEIVARERLVKANGTVELLTLVAILTGTFVGARIIDTLSVGQCYLILIGTFALSYALNHAMTRTPANPEALWKDSSKEFFSNFAALWRSPRLARILIGTALFWVCGAMIKMNLQPWGISIVGAKTNTQIALLGLYLSIGIMIGSVAAGQLFGVGNLKGTRPTGFALAALVALIGILPSVSNGSALMKALPIGLLIVAGIAAGLFLIPLNAALQAESHQGKLGKTIATQNFLDNIAMILGAAVVLVAIQAKFSSSGLFILLAVIIAVVVAGLKIPEAKPDTHESAPVQSM